MYAYMLVRIHFLCVIRIVDPWGRLESRMLPLVSNNYPVRISVSLLMFASHQDQRRALQRLGELGGVRPGTH